MKKVSFDIKFRFVITFSKVMALLLLIAVYLLKDAALMTFSIPFIVGLILGKQFFDAYFNSPKGVPPIVDNQISDKKEKEDEDIT